MAADIVIKGAREHNLRDVTLTLPRNKLICLTGVSGSGKSSLAFDTLYAEGQRRYVESLSTFARQFLGQMPKPDVDLISGLSPSISISQKSSGQNPRSTVGTITEIYDFLRVLFARCGQGHCPQCGRPITAQTREQIIDRISVLPEGTKFALLAPLIRGQKGEHRDLFEDLLKQGFVRARVDGDAISLSSPPSLDRQMRHDIEVVVDRLQQGPSLRARLAEAVDLALKIGKGNLIVALEGDAKATAELGRAESEASDAKPADTDDEEPDIDENDDEEADDDTASKGRPLGGGRGAESNRAKAKRRANPNDISLSAHYACTPCGISFEPPSPQLFSFNSPQGMCPECDGLGEVYGLDPGLMIPNPGRSFKQGTLEVLGPWADMGRWKRHIYQGVADTLEHKLGLDAGTILETAWEELDPELQRQLLFGTGDLHVTYTWRNGPSGHKYGGKYEGIVPELTSKYKQSKSGMQRRQLEKYMRVLGCTSCHGARLNAQARAVRISTTQKKFAEHKSLGLPEICALSVSDAIEYFSELDLDPIRQTIAVEVLKEIRGRLGFLANVGLEYLTLERTAPTLSGGESQRIRLAGQIGCGLVGVLYILDEPSIGLHPRDNDRLIATLERLRDLGNTVVVVEHDEDTMRAADHLIDFGPGPGVRGGEVVASGTFEEICKSKRSLTGQFLAGDRKIEIPAVRRQPKEAKLRVVAAAANNLKKIDVEIPVGLFVCVTGASGSGKSSLVNDILVEALNRDLNGGLGSPGAYEKIEGLEHLDKLIAIDQSPIGRTPRSNPSTYIKVFDDIRKLYSQLPDAKARGYQEGRFSFNVEGGRCEACEGNGSTRLEMDFLADVWVKCPICDGHRFNRETLQVRFKGKNIAEVLEMDIQQALEHFANIPAVAHKLQTLHDVGLDYLKLGQPSPTLSGGEAQRVKLARELVKKSTGRTLYLLDEPTTGLHFADISLLLKVLHDFAEAGNTVLVVEHNLDVIKTADWVIDLGPDGGAGGGRIVAQGTPEQVAEVAESHTGRALRRFLFGAGHKVTDGAAKKRGPQAPELRNIKVRGARQHNLKSVDVEIPRDKITVCCGPSGSGKSSLAMDTIYAEGQRRYVESLSSYARQFVGQMQKPQLEHIEGLSPAIAIEQKHLGHTPRSTVGTVTEIYDYLRILFARLGNPYCPTCDIPIGTQTVDQIVDRLMSEPEGTKLFLTAPVEVQVGERYETLFEELRAQGYQRVRIDGKTIGVDQPPAIDRRRKHSVEVVIDRTIIRAGTRSRTADSVEAALSIGKGVMNAVYVDDDVPEEKWRTEIHSRHLSCRECGRSFEALGPHNFSFNSALGWCPSCEGLGMQTGANPAALLHDPKLTLAKGAVALWPEVKVPLFRSMLAALSKHLGVPVDVPFEQLGAKARRMIFHGRGEEWIDVPNPGEPDGLPLFRFQYKGLYPALEEAARLSPALRGRLDHLVDEVECSICGGGRLRDDAGAVRFHNRTLEEIQRTPLGPLVQWLDSIKLSTSDRKVAGELWREVRNRLQFLTDVGLEYLTLGRSAPTLSGGESQRIRLASQVGSGLTGVLYVLDEPTIGLHPRDNLRLVNALYKLRDLGNTLLMVEHDKEVIAGADQLLDFGPRAGVHGGQVVARGTPAEIGKQKGSVTGPYLTGAKAIAVPTNRRCESVSGGGAAAETKSSGKPAKGKKKKQQDFFEDDSYATIASRTAVESRILAIVGATHNNLQNVTVEIPLGTVTVVTGVSGSGKSSLVEDVLYNSLARTLHRARTFPGKHERLKGVEQIDKVIRVDQMPLGQTPTSNPATYTGVFDQVRTLYSNLPESKLRGYTPRRFSFNVPGGRCEKCEGAGQLRIEMHFLPDVWVECDECRGKRYNPETLAVQFHGHSIADVLDMPVAKARDLFQNIPQIRKILQTLCDVGLDYVTLGQPAPTLSGGEAQRVKLAAELSRPDTGRTLYLLDEPTTGLHFEDLAKLLDVLQRLVDLGNTVVVIEHNLDVIKTADWLIDVGPEAGEGGGRIVVAGTPEDVVAHARAWQSEQKKPAGKGKKPESDERLRSYTGEMLAPVLEAGPHVERKSYDPEAAEAPQQDDVNLDDVGEEVQMPWEADGRRWHVQDRVARNGKPVRWDGRILAETVDKIQDLGEFGPTNFNTRTIVEICGDKKSDGWFFHAVTGEEWLLKLKFRTAKNTFRREELVAKLDLKPLNEMRDLPVYGTEPRVKCKNLRGPWQEVQLQVHGWDEVDKPVFWEFVEAAVKGFQKFADRKELNPADVMPWKVLGQKWHFARKGFPPGKKVAWDVEVLEELCELLTDTHDGQFLWNNQQLVHYCLKGRSEPWATIQTKKTHAVELYLNGPKNKFALGRVTALGVDPAIDKDRPDRDVVRLQFNDPEQIVEESLGEFLREHAAAVGEK